MIRFKQFMHSVWNTRLGTRRSLRRQRLRRPSRSLLFEVCEPRLAFSTIDFGTVSATNPTLHREGAITSTNPADEYRFTLAASTAIRANLSGLSQNLNLALTDGTGKVLRTSNLAGNSIENFATTLLPAGNYALRVAPVAGAVSNYVLTVSQNYSTDDLVTNAVNVANLSTGAPTFTTSNAVNRARDLQDYHRFTVDSSTPLRVNLSGMTSNADVQILDSFGRPISAGASTGNSLENFVTPVLTPGSYIARVFAVDVNSPYSLAISQDLASDDLLPGAIDLGTLTSTTPTVRMRQALSSGGDVQDYFRFTVGAQTTVSANLSGLSSDLELELQDAFGNVKKASKTAGTTIEEVNDLLAPGTYYLRVFASSSGFSSYDLTVTQNHLSDDTILKAVDLGALTIDQPSRHLTNSINSASDIQDYFRIALTSEATLSLNLFGMTGNVNFEVLDDKGRFRDAGTIVGTNVESIETESLLSGTYYLRVFPTANVTSNYSLTVSVLPSTDDLLSNAVQLGSIKPSSPTVDVAGIVGGVGDVQDMYAFVTEATESLRINLSGLTSDTNVQLLDVEGRSLALGNASSVAIENLGRAGVVAGTYYIRVFATANSTYRLTVSRNVNSDDLITNAISLGELNPSRPTALASSTAGSVFADIQDYYKFTLTETSGVRLNLNGLSADLNVQLLDSFGRLVMAGTNVGTTIENAFITGLNPGNYHVVVSGLGSSAYDLTVSTAIASDDLLSNATNLGALASSSPAARSFGSAGAANDIQDYYTFQLNALSAVRLNLTGMTAGLDVQLLNGVGQIVASGNLAGTAVENVLASGLNAGTYFIRVMNSPTSTLATNYELIASINTNGDDLFTQSINLGNLTSSARPSVRMTSAVGRAVDIHDYYKFALTTTSDVRIFVGSMSADVDVQVLDAMGRAIAFGGAVGTLAENLLLTSLSAGTYHIRVFPVSPAISANYDLVASVRPTSDDLLSGATSLGTLSAAVPTLRTTGAVGGAADIQDYLKFTLSSASSVRLNLSGMSADHNVELQDGNGRVLAASNLTGKTIENALASGLAAGTYFVRVSPVSGASSYDLTVSISTTSDDLLTSPVNVGELTSPDRPTVQFIGVIGGLTDIHDYYRFTIGTQRDVRITLGNLNADANVQVLDVDGSVIASGNRTSTQLENLLLPQLTAGTYFVRVVNFAFGFTSYDLAINVDGNVDEIINNARSLGTLDPALTPTLRFSSSVGAMGDVHDYYSFTLSSSSDVRLNLSGMSANLQLVLLNQDGRILNIGTATENSIENILVSGLAAGTYYLRIFSLNGPSDYDLAVSTAVTSNELLTNARSLGTLDRQTFPTVRLSDRLDGATARDYYSFTIDSVNNVRVNLSGLLQDLDIFLLDPFGKRIGSSLNGGSQIENILGSALVAGTYYILVVPFGDVSSSYELTVGLDPFNDSNDLITNAFDLGILDLATLPTRMVTARTGGAADFQDYYRFVLSTSSDLRVNLSGLTDDLDVNLLNESGRVIASSLSSASTVENILTSALSAGIYYVRVFSTNEVFSDYDLGISVATNSDDLIVNSTSLGTLNNTTPTTFVVNDVAGGPADIHDYYRFTVNDASEIRIDLGELTTDLDWRLLDDRGRVITESTGDFSVQKMIVSGLANGEYRLRVFGFLGESNYRLAISNLTDSDNSFVSATNLTPVVHLQPAIPTVRRSGTLSVTTDPEDYFEFDLANANSVRINVSGLTSDLDVELLDSAGTIVAHGREGGTLIENVLATGLAEGKYYVRVFAFAGASDYDLSVTVNTESNQSISQAVDLGILNTARTTTFGTKPVVQNGAHTYFQFTLATRSDVRLNVSGLSQSVELQLLDQFGRLIKFDTNGFGSGLASIQDLLVSGLAAGTYYAHTGNISSSYELTVSIDTSSTNLISNAPLLGTAPKIIGGRIDSHDLQRYARITLPEDRNYRIALTRATDDLDIQLLDANGRLVDDSFSAGGFDRTISGGYTSGTYYVRIFALELGITSDFEVSIQFFGS